MRGLRISELEEIKSISNHTVGGYSVAIGNDALKSNEDGLFNVAVGNSAINTNNKITMGGMADEIWKLMYEMPVIVRCGYCNSHNVISNTACIQCGAPGGNFIK